MKRPRLREDTWRGSGVHALRQLSKVSPHSSHRDPWSKGLPQLVLGFIGIFFVWEITNQEKIHAFAVMKISNLLVKSISLFRDKSKFESLLSVINSLHCRVSLRYLAPLCGLEARVPGCSNWPIPKLHFALSPCQHCLVISFLFFFFSFFRGEKVEEGLF